MKTYIYGHDSFDTAYEVSDYPWGFRLRTEVRYWIETLDKTRGGQRFCKCTKDPRSGKWCAPKKGTYSALKAMYFDENGHVNRECIHPGYDRQFVPAFAERHKGNLTAYQVETIKLLNAVEKATKGLTVTLVANPSEEEREEIRINKERVHAQIRNRVCRILSEEEKQEVAQEA